MSDRRDFFEGAVYHAVDRRRYTQQSPVMPDVWIHYGLEPGKQIELLMVPNWHYTPAQLAEGLKARLAARPAKAAFRESRGRKPAAVAYNQNAVVARLSFDEMVRAAMPLSAWWAGSVARMGQSDRLAAALADPGKFARTLSRAMEQGAAAAAAAAVAEVSRDMVWLARVVGLLAYIATPPGKTLMKRAGRSEEKQVAALRRLFDNHALLARTVVALLEGIDGLEPDSALPLYSVNRNRMTTETLFDSVQAVKADAAHRVFQVRGEGVRWAVVDSGMDARHVAFRRRDGDGVADPEPFPERKPRQGRRRRVRAAATPEGHANRTRVVATYDFVHVRELLGTEPSAVARLDKKKFPGLQDASMRKRLREYLEKAGKRVIDWEGLEPFLRVPHDPQYRPPVNRHGTHVAGIIGADWRAADADVSRPDGEALATPSWSGHDLTGIAPEIELYDLRVLDDVGQGNEFAIMSALQFVRDLNNRKDFVQIHGVNLSFSIAHDVANYACGRTPVCDEAERLVSSGISVVAAAGNNGRARYLTPAGIPDDGFRTVSLTDPGNAEAVITVGATHRRDAHTYGVSYFSSRGPTGDGRLKPDLVAPGEKILSTVPGDADDRLDGTSMAAPHVSAAVALILARHPELMGKPARIKEILCSTATDLGRERYFQGAGLLDILRALQAI